MEEERKKVGFNTKEERKKVEVNTKEEEIKVDKKKPKKKGKIKFYLISITVSFFLFFLVFKAWLEESGFLEDVKPKPKPVIGTPRGRSFSPKKRNAVKCKIKCKS